MSTSIEIGNLVATVRSLATRAQAVIDMGVSPQAMAVILDDVLKNGDANVDAVISEAVNTAITQQGDVSIAVQAAVSAAIDQGTINGTKPEDVQNIVTTELSTALAAFVDSDGLRAKVVTAIEQSADSGEVANAVAATVTNEVQTKLTDAITNGSLTQSVETIVQNAISAGTISGVSQAEVDASIQNAIQDGSLNTAVEGAVQTAIDEDRLTAVSQAQMDEAVDAALLRPLSMLRYDLASVTATTTLDLASSQVFQVSASANRSLSFANAPGANRAMTVAVHLHSIDPSYSITWPSAIKWSEGEAPMLDGTDMTVVLFWSGTSWIGSVGATA